MSRAGELAIVLHSHMPYVEGFGSWPFGEEWLWEAIATSYLPVLDILDTGAPLTLSLTPVLCDQLEAPGALQRCDAFLAGIRVESHRRDIEAAAGQPGVVRALEHSAAQYARARDHLDEDLLAKLGRHAAWTSSATHAILPLLATDAGVRLQLRAGLDAHRHRFEQRPWRGGLWLPECAYAPHLDALLEEVGVHAVCVDLTDVLEPDGHLRPLRSPAGPTLVPIDRQTIELVWSRGGYPADPAYRSYHAFTRHRHRAWSNDGVPYDPQRAAGAARRHGADFVARTRAHGGLAVCAVDTELIGDWWHEGPLWLQAVVDEAAAQGLQLAHLDDALQRYEPAPAPPDLPVTSWGTPRDLATWSAPPVAAMAWEARDAELRAVRAGTALDERAARELLALQSSDWAFLVSRDLAKPYGRERAAGHRAVFDAALKQPGAHDPALRNLAPHASPAALLEP